ncbi:MAG TPA: NHL repeat-containing protein [Gemmataceae bacterium]|nr:NHL repeat-containing protein [Gemmataceae bacterium]
MANGYQIMAHRAQRMTVLLRRCCSAGRSSWWCIPLVLALLIAGGCGPHDEPELVFGQRGTQPGDMVRPRAAAIDAQDRIYVVDFTARIQVFDRDGQFLNIGWTTPDYRNGRPSGLSIDRDNNLIVSDSHYHCFRIYSHDGKELRKIGGEAGTGPGQLGYISDVVQDEDGYYYVAEFCENQRITKLDKDGKFIKFWGSAGTEPGQFGRIRALALGPDKNLYVVDATNHRIQVFTRGGELVDCWGEPGSEPGKLSYPHDLAFGKHGELYVIERGNHRVQKFTTKGQSLGCWGGPGREPGRFHEPWALAVDSHGKVFVIDTENHRVQRISF